MVINEFGHVLTVQKCHVITLNRNCKCVNVPPVKKQSGWNDTSTTCVIVSYKAVRNTCVRYFIFSQKMLSHLFRARSLLISSSLLIESPDLLYSTPNTYTVDLVVFFLYP